MSWMASSWSLSNQSDVCEIESALMPSRARSSVMDSSNSDCQMCKARGSGLPIFTITLICREKGEHTFSLRGLVSSNRRSIFPLYLSAKNRFRRAALECPMWRYPEGSGAEERAEGRPVELFH